MPVSEVRLLFFQLALLFIGLGLLSMAVGVRASRRKRAEQSAQHQADTEKANDIQQKLIEQFEYKELQNIYFRIRGLYDQFSHRALLWRGKSYPDFDALIGQATTDDPIEQESFELYRKVSRWESPEVVSGSVAFGSTEDVATVGPIQSGSVTIEPTTFPLPHLAFIKNVESDYFSNLDSLGTTDDDLRLRVPVPPPHVRRKHTYVIGSTGSGKTTLLEHYIRADLKHKHPFAVISPEAHWFVDRVLPALPEESLENLVYFAPGSPDNTICFNPLHVEPGHDVNRVAEDIFTSLTKAMGDEDLGPRSKPILQNTLSAVICRKGSTLRDVKRFLERTDFREHILANDVTDDYTREYWQQTFPKYPADATVPLITRLDTFLRPPAMREALCQPKSSFTVRSILDEGKIFLLDMSGLSSETALLIGQLILSKFQLALMARERLRGAYTDYTLYADEFQDYAPFAVSTWNQLLSRGRKYGLSLVLAHQFPSQLPTALLNTVLGNVGSIVCFRVRTKDATVVTHELLERGFTEEEDQGYKKALRGDGEYEVVKKIRTVAVGDHPFDPQEISALPTGTGILKCDRKYATRVRVDKGVEFSDSTAGARILQKYREMNPRQAQPLRDVPTQPDEDEDEFAS